MSTLQIKDAILAYGSDVLNIPRFKDEIGVYRDYWEHPDSYNMFQSRFSGSKFPRHQYTRLGIKFKDKKWVINWFDSHHIRDLTSVVFYHLDECDILEEVFMELNSKASDQRLSNRKDHPFKVFLSISSPKVISNIIITNSTVERLCEIISDNFTNISAKARGITTTYLVYEKSGELLLDKTNYKFVAISPNSKVPLNISLPF